MSGKRMAKLGAEKSARSLARGEPSRSSSFSLGGQEYLPNDDMVVVQTWLHD